MSWWRQTVSHLAAVYLDWATFCSDHFLSWHLKTDVSSNNINTDYFRRKTLSLANHIHQVWLLPNGLTVSFCPCSQTVKYVHQIILSYDKRKLRGWVARYKVVGCKCKIQTRSNKSCMGKITWLQLPAFYSYTATFIHIWLFLSNNQKKKTKTFFKFELKMVFKSNTFERFTYRTPIPWFYTSYIKNNGINHWSVFLIDKTQWDKCSVDLTKLFLYYTQTIFNFETNLKRVFQVFDRNIKF